MKQARNDDVLKRATLAADAKHGTDGDLPCSFCAAMMRPIHAAITIACTGTVDRRTIERRLCIGRFMLDDYMSSKPKMLPFDAVARLLFDPTVLGSKAHAMLRRMILVEMNLLAFENIERVSAAEIPMELLDVIDTAGALAAEVREAQDPDSPGGTAIVEMEHVSIGARAKVVMSEAAPLIPGRCAQ